MPPIDKENYHNMGRSIADLIGEEKEIPCSNKNGNIQGVAKIRDETKLNGTFRVKLDFVGHIESFNKDEMIRELEGFVKNIIYEKDMKLVTETTSVDELSYILGKTASGAFATREEVGKGFKDALMILKRAISELETDEEE